MARIRTILSAARKASGRNSKAIRTATGNNMFYFGYALLFMLDPMVIAFFGVVMALVVFMPSSADPMAAVPRERMMLWPLSPSERRWLRLLTPWLNPLTWVMLAGLLWKRVTWGLWAFVAGFFAAGFLSPGLLRTRPFPRVYLPGAPLTWLVRKDLRQMLTALDLYCALLISGFAGVVLRVQGVLPKDALVPLTMVVLIMMSTVAITLFGLDGEGGLTRYRLMPVAGWKVLAAKGIAFTALTLLVTLPLSPLGGLAGSLCLLAVGNWLSTARPATQSRWRFRASNAFGPAILQMLFGLLGAGLVTQLGAQWMPLCVACYAATLWWAGRRFRAAS